MWGCMRGQEAQCCARGKRAKRVRGPKGQCMKPKVGESGRSRSPRMELAGRKLHSGVYGRRSSRRVK